MPLAWLCPFPMARRTWLVLSPLPQEPGLPSQKLSIGFVRGGVTRLGSGSLRSPPMHKAMTTVLNLQAPQELLSPAPRIPSEGSQVSSSS